MKYSVEIERNIDALSYCLNKVNDEIDNICDWDICINANMINYGIYFNFDINNGVLEICNAPACDDFTPLDDVIEMINGIDDDEE